MPPQWTSSLPVDAWSEQETSIDFSERAHSAIRRDLESNARGTDFAYAANRQLVRQSLAVHLARGGTDPSTKDVRAILKYACVDVGAPQPKNKKACNAYLAFSNGRRQAWKALVAPDRPMSDAEVGVMESRIADDWERIRADPRQFAFIASASRADFAKRQRSSDDVDVVSTRFDGPWGLSDDRNYFIEPSAVVKAMSASTAAARQGRPCPYSKETQKQKLLVQSPVVDRVSAVKRGHALMFGCFTNKKTFVASMASTTWSHDLGSRKSSTPSRIGPTRCRRRSSSLRRS